MKIWINHKYCNLYHSNRMSYHEIIIVHVCKVLIRSNFSTDHKKQVLLSEIAFLNIYVLSTQNAQNILVKLHYLENLRTWLNIQNMSTEHEWFMYRWKSLSPPYDLISPYIYWTTSTPAGIHKTCYTYICMVKPMTFSDADTLLEKSSNHFSSQHVIM